MVHEKQYLDPATGELVVRNTNFVQFYDDSLELISQISDDNPTALKVFLWLVRMMDDKNAIVTSQVAIAEALKMHRNTVSSCVSYLKSKKILHVFKSGTTNVYALNEQVVWRESADLKKYAHFSAKIYIVGSEQEVEYQTSMFGHATKKKPKPMSKKMRTEKPSEFT